MTGMDDLITWLRAVLDDLERVALQVLSFESEGFEWEYHWARHGRYNGRVTRQTFEPGAPSPRHVLAQVDATRRMIERYALYADAQWPDFEGGYASATEDMVKLAAEAYASRPGYRNEWRLEP